MSFCYNNKRLISYYLPRLSFLSAAAHKPNRTAAPPHTISIRMRHRSGETRAAAMAAKPGDFTPNWEERANAANERTHHGPVAAKPSGGQISLDN